MRKLYLALAFVAQMAANAHGGSMATQTFYFSDNIVELEFKIDLHTLSHVSEEAFGQDFDQKKGILIMQYINVNMDFSIDSMDIPFELVGTQQNENFLIVNLEATVAKTQDVDIEIKNNLFYLQNPSFQNRVVIDHPKKQTSYRLTNTQNILKIHLL